MWRCGVAFVAEDDSIDSRVYLLSMMIVRECLSAKLQNTRSCFIRRGRLGLCDIHNVNYQSQSRQLERSKRYVLCRKSIWEVSIKAMNLALLTNPTMIAFASTYMHMAMTSRVST